MATRNTEDDNWGQLLSNFGIEDNAPEKAVKPIETGEQHNSEAEIVSESPEPRGKKSIFSRFPKMNFFGTPPDVSLDSVIEDVKSPSLGGKAFTDNKLEKVPLSQEWEARREKSETNVPVDPDALSTVASQIDALASGRNAHIPSDERPARRRVVSMFDDPIPESEEERALKSMMGETSRREDHREEPRRAAFRDDVRADETDSWQRGRGRERQKPQPRENDVRGGRGSRYRPPVDEKDMPESDFEPMDDDMPKTRGRGGRGSRYAGADYRNREREPIRENVEQEEWSEVDAALQAGRGEPAQHGGRRQRYDKRRGGPERSERSERSAFDREPSDFDDSTVVAVHGSVPSWDEAVGDIITANIARHKSFSGKGRR